MTFHLCLYLDARGYPCNRRTMAPLSMCELHRTKAMDTRKRGPSAEYQRARRKRIALSDLAPGTEAA